MLIDFERGRIIATQAIHENFNWSQLVHKPIRDGKPASISTVKLKQQAEPVIDPQQLLLDRETNQAVERLVKEYWDNYYESIDESNNRKSQRILFGGSADGLTMLSEDFEIKGQRDIRVDDRNSKWYIKQDNDGNSVYCNKVTNGWTDFNFGSAGWSDYSISYRMKFSTGKGGTTETHIRKMGDRDYRARISSYGGVEIQLKNSTIARGYVSTKTGEWLDIQLTASGDNIKYLVDGEVVASAKDDRVKKGAGMIAVSANAEVCIDDIAVKEI